MQSRGDSFDIAAPLYSYNSSLRCAVVCGRSVLQTTVRKGTPTVDRTNHRIRGHIQFADCHAASRVPYPSRSAKYPCNLKTSDKEITLTKLRSIFHTTQENLTSISNA